MHGFYEPVTDGMFIFVIQVRGLLVMAPEWQMSLKLKFIEYYRQGEMQDEGEAHAVRQTLHVIQSMAMWNVLDESDEALHYR
jgi:hypothetical protein